MLARRFRLPIKEFRNQPKKVISTPIFLVKFSNNSLGYNRFGVIISNKIVNSAVRRNYWKRRIVHSIELWPKIGRDVLFTANPGLDEVSKDELKTEIEKILTKIK